MKVLYRNGLFFQPQKTSKHTPKHFSLNKIVSRDVTEGKNYFRNIYFKCMDSKKQLLTRM